MKTAHFLVFTPGRCGLFATALELIKALRETGVDARVIDPAPDKNPIYETLPKEFEGVPIETTSWANGADILINHSGLGEYEKLTSKPIIHVNHGRPKYSFINEMNGGTPVYSYHYNKSKDPRYKASITFWPEHVPYHEVMWHPKPVVAIPAPVDLDFWTPEGPSGYKFGGKGGDKNIVITDAWREDIDPFTAVNAFILYNRKYKDAKLHIYGAKNQKGWGALLQKLKDEDGLGEILPWVKGLDNVYRSADLTLTPHTIAVRTIRESMACGCPVLSVATPDADMVRDAMQEKREVVRALAVSFYNPTKSATKFKEILDGFIR